MQLTSPVAPALAQRIFTVQLLGVTSGAAGSPADRANTTVPASVTRWRPLNVTIRAASAVGTLALATFGIYTQAAAAGTTIVTAAALTTISAANKFVASTVAAVTDGITDTGIFARQTVDGTNAGTLDIIIECIDLS